MPGEFEQELQNRMQDFRVSPGPELWKQVAAALPEEKRKRRFIFWWLLPIGLLLAGGIWYMTGNRQTETGAKRQLVSQNDTAADGGIQATIKPADSLADGSKHIITASPKTTHSKLIVKTAPVLNAVKQNQAAIATNKADLNQTKPGVKSKVNVLTRPGAAYPSKPLAKTNQRQEVTLETTVGKTISFAASKTGSGGKTRIVTTGDPGFEVETGKPSFKLALKDRKAIIAIKDPPVWAGSDSSTANSFTEMYNHTPTTAGFIVSKDITSNIPMGKLVKTADVLNGSNSGISGGHDSSATETLVTGTSKQPVVAKKKAGLLKWGFYIAAGSSNAEDKLFGSMEKSLNYASNISQGTTVIYASPSQPTAGFSYAIGTERLLTVDKYWQWYTAVQYGFMSNHQKTGSRKDSSLIIYDNSGYNNSLSSTTTTIHGFYYSGTTTSHTNTIHQLSLQTGLRYVMNPLAKRPLGIRVGVNVNQQFATNQLLYDSYQNIYYYSHTATRHFTTGMILGLDWMLARKLTVGGFFQYNFSAINKLEAGRNLHWRAGGLRLSIPFGK
ncbi:MAG: hypothetical protein ABIX01_05680 [Chitinophagaceae bacterium]